MAQTKQDLQTKNFSMKSAIDIQALLQLLVEKEIITREEMADARAKVKNAPKYKATATYLEEALRQVEYYEHNQQELLRDMLNKKLGK